MSSEKTKLVPKLRFPEFRGAEGWGTEKVDTLVETVTPPQKLPTSMYAASGTFPIIDQSQSYICGWTDDKESLIQQGLPLIVFGDHTCILKLIDRPFAQGADGIKILKARPTVLATYLYQFLGYRPVITEEYKRHFSTLKEKAVFFPNVKTGEQQKIADCLSSVDELIAAQARKVDALKTHKKGLMQQLFPIEGETQPRLRFPEFRGAGEWECLTLADVAQISSGTTPSRSNSEFFNGGIIPWVKTTDLNNALISQTEECITPKARARVNPVGSVLVAMYGGFNQIGRTGCLRVPAATNQALSVLVLDKNRALPVYVLAWLNAKIDVWKRIASSSRKDPNITGADVAKFPITLPKPDEQQRIAICLTSLDQLITAATQELDALKTHKKGLMQQLFPSVAMTS